MLHRSDQIVQYVGFVDCVDTENGHGTHVAGSAAGGLSNSSPGEHFGDGVSYLAALGRGVVGVLGLCVGRAEGGGCSTEPYSIRHYLLGGEMQRTATKRQENKTGKGRNPSTLCCR